jgi:hypothetical protein
MSGPAIDGPLKRVDLLVRLNNPPEPAKLANPIIIMNVSKIVKQQHPLSNGSMPTALETTLSIAI